MENLIWWIIGGIFLYLIFSRFLSRAWLEAKRKRSVEEEINEILTKDEYKVKGRND